MSHSASRHHEAGRKLFVGGIPAGVDQHVVKDDFMVHGDIEDVYLPQDHATGKLRGIAFVTYVRAEDAHEAAGAMHGRDYHGRKITCTMAKPKDPKPEGAVPYRAQGGKAQYSYSRPRDYYREDEERRAYQEGQERQRDHHRDAMPDGEAYNGTERWGGQYGARDPRPVQDYYD